MKALLVLLALVNSLNAFAGNCDCPNQTAKNGSRCGERSAFCRPGGNEPMCGAKNEKEKAQLFKKWCPKTYINLKNKLGSGNSSDSSKKDDDRR